MNEVLSIASMIVIVAPIAIGLAAFAGYWLKKHFYADPFYDDYDE